jgi:hypothetical protein
VSERQDGKRGRLWLTIGEGAAILAVIIAALNYWDSHREHVDQARRDAAQASRDAAQASQASLASALILQGDLESEGRRLGLKSVDPSQVIQSQRFIFPQAVLDHPVDVTAQAPGIDAGWISAGLDKLLDARHAKGDGRDRVPVAVVTTYLEHGQSRQDRSLYLVGYAWKHRFLGGREITLQGLAFRSRAGSGDLQAAVDKAANG